jgi:hypothetical protein
LCQASRANNKDIISFFIDEGANNWNGALSGAAKGGHKDLVLFFIEKGANCWGWAMTCASEGGHEDLVTLLEEIRQKKVGCTNKE